MNHLMRGLAPVSDTAWAEIEDEAKRTLKVTLAARKVVDFVGPRGWAASAVDLGRAKPLRSALGRNVSARLREVQPLVELQVPFKLSLAELEAIDRGAADADLGPVVEAARTIAMAEDAAIFHGYGTAGITGIVEAAAGNALKLPKSFATFPELVAESVSKLRDAGVAEPYAIVLSAACYKKVTETTRDGFPVLNHVRRLVDGPLVWAPGIKGAVVMSLRGGDFELTVGQDLSIGYAAHSASEVSLYLEESFTFRALAPEAAVPLST